MSDVTQVLAQIKQGDPAASEQLLPLVYSELRRLAAARLANEKPGQTLQATALVHEAYVKLVGGESPDSWDSRGHFFAAAAEAMRRILVDKAREKRAQKRGGGKLRRIELDDAVTIQQEPDRNDQLLALDIALDRLEQQDAVKAELVKLRYFAGLTGAQAAEALGIGVSTADKYWAYAKVQESLFAFRLRLNLSTLAPLSPKLVWGEGLGVRGNRRESNSRGIMGRRSGATNRSSRDPGAIAFARDQRARANEFAQDVWQMLRGRRCRGVKFRREHPIPPYTVDFCCVALKLIIEVDGEHHLSEEGRRRDQRRDAYLKERGYEVLRIPGYQVVRDAAGVRTRIEQAIDQRVKQKSPSPPTPLPSDQGEHHSP